MIIIKEEDMLRENTQLIHVSADTELKKNVINYALQCARTSLRYAKFYSNKYYIEVTFQRDNTVRISSNYRTNPTFNRQINQIDTGKFKQSDTVNFIWLWMNRIRKF
jgi:hypothetical protein